MAHTTNEKGAILVEVSGAAGALVGGSGANTQVAYWTGPNTIDGDAGFTYDPATDTATLSGGLVLDGGASSVITVNDNVANALTLVDAGGIEYLRLITTNGQPAVVWNEGGADVDHRWEASGQPNALFIRGSDGYVGLWTSAPARILDIAGGIVNFQVGVTSTDDTAGYMATDPTDIAFFMSDSGYASIGGDTNLDSTNLNIHLTTGYVGMGTVSPDRLHHVEVADAATNTIIYAQRLSHITSNTAVAGFGTGIEFELEENDGSNKVAGLIQCLWSDAGEGANADGYFNFKTMLNDGVAGSRMVVGYLGRVGVNTPTPDNMFHAFDSGITAKIERGDAGVTGVSAVAVFHRSSTGTTEDDFGGSINLSLESDVGTERTAATISWHATDITDASFDGAIGFSTRVDLGALTERVRITGAGYVGIGITAGIAGQTHIDQSSNSAAIPVLVLDQADISEGTINFIASDRGVITGATNSLKSVRVEIGGVVHRLALYVDA